MNINRKSQAVFVLISFMTFSGCGKMGTPLKHEPSEIVGTWQLVSGTVIQGEDTTVTDYTKGQEMIKIINDTHFAFLRHDLKAAEDSNKVFVAGGGTYTIKGNIYTEHLEYFTLREWEGNSFELAFTINGDTLITKGVEEVADLNVSYFNIEEYLRVPQ